MKITSLLKAGCVLLSTSPFAGAAQTLTNIDFTPTESTSWSGTLPTVRLDFGPGVGMGTISYTSVNSGFFALVSAPADYNGGGFSSYTGPTTLSNGDIYSPTKEVVFSIRPGSGAVGLSGIRMTVTLDSGVFPAGSVFGIRSLGRNTTTGGYQTLDILSGLAAADSVRLPTDDAFGTPPDFVETTPGHFEASANGSNAVGRAFQITAGSFSVDLLGTYVGGGEAFTITTPVPEPSAVVLLSVLGLAGLGVRRRA